MKITDNKKIYYLVRFINGREVLFDTYEKAVDYSKDHNNVMHQITEVTEQLLDTHIPAKN